MLTDGKFFQGSLEYLKRIRGAVQLPLLRKDFIIDERQILEAVEWGADAILLIAAILSDAQLKRFHELATGSGLAALVEVHDEAELDRAERGSGTDRREQPQPEDLQGGPGHDRAARRALALSAIRHTQHNRLGSWWPRAASIPGRMSSGWRVRRKGHPGGRVADEARRHRALKSASCLAADQCPNRRLR